MSRVLLIATGNRHKAAELSELLAGISWQMKCLADMPPAPEPAEDGATFEANALTKARYYCDRLRLPCVADDSGIEVNALGGAPGVRSARYAGPECDPAKNNAKLLTALAGVPEEKRSARFVCVAAFAGPDGVTHIETGFVTGRIAPECRGVHGFGYDPLFIPEGYELTFGELAPSLKQMISHRARAFQKMRAYLESVS